MGCKGILCTRSKRPTCPKSVSFCREEECAVFTADDYDRTPVAPSRDLSTRDYQELEEVLCDSLRRGRGQFSVGVLPLLQNPEPPSSPPPPTKFPTSPGRFTSFSFLPVNVSPPPDPSQQTSRPAPSPPRNTQQQAAPPQRTFPGFAFMSVVPVPDTPAPKPSPVPESRPMNFIRVAPIVTRATSPPPASASVQRPSSPVVPVSCSFKRAPPQQQQQHPSHMVTRPSQQSGPSAQQSVRSPPSPSGFRSPASGQALPLCVPTGGAPTSPPHSLLRTLAS